MKLNKNLIIGLFSCSIESYTSSLYVFAGPELKANIFPYLSADSATFFHYLILALGLLCYPLGGNLFGFIGDKIGRKKALTYSSLGLALSTGLLGLVPLGFSGLWVYLPAILFTVLFCLQHFCSGGDYSSSAIFTVEHVEPNNTKKLIYYSGLACVMSVLGLILAQYMGGSGLWRIGCFTGFIGAIFAFYIRKKSEETPVFTAEQASSSLTFSPLPPLSSFRKFEQSLVFIFAGFLCSAYYFIFIFLTPHLFIPQGHLLRDINLAYFVLYAASLLIGGIIASKHNLLKITQNFTFILLLVFIQFVLILSQMDINSPYFLSISAVLISLMVILMGLIISPQHALYLCLFPERLRCQAIITSFTLGCAIIGGITPFLCKWIFSISGNLGLTALWPSACTGALLASLIIYNRRSLKTAPATPFTVGS